MKKNTISKDADTDEGNFLVALRQIVLAARMRSYAAINAAQIETNWLIGRQLVEQEQHTIS